ncbi:hypothetical protein S101258_00387 [Lactiplantibacillus plantarum subsp. plantarum]|uniref:Uncharacterized protein n=1 Tax=Lactiplantibacillus plantarum subsp. plantarum TaxID=337330 RepID=A0A2S3U977_LACPN|nr:hypothetical protein S101258_00387 [Lactiplantibacillus plantarum subsp. plantarum]
MKANHDTQSCSVTLRLDSDRPYAPIIRIFQPHIAGIYEDNQRSLSVAIDTGRTFSYQW